jgi:pimeloyl-ACP methyl ester carboxylesterase
VIKAINVGNRNPQVVRPFTVPRTDYHFLVKEPRGYRINADHDFLPDKNLALHYVPFGEVAPKIVVLIHGLSHSLIHFDRLAAELARRYGIECISLGLPGHYGDSKQYTESEFAQLTLEDYVSDVRAKLDAIANRYGRQLVVLGHSMGGLVTLQALTSPDLATPVCPGVSGVILLSSAGTSDCGRIRRTPAMLGAVLANAVDLLAGKPLIMNEGIMRSSFFNGAISPAEFEWFIQTVQPEANGATWQLIRAAFGPIVPRHYSPRIDLGTRSVLNMFAECDRLVAPATALELAKRLKTRAGAITTHPIRQAPHDSMITHPQEVARIISLHLDNL